jgi:hypothetical protein
MLEHPRILDIREYFLDEIKVGAMKSGVGEMTFGKIKAETRDLIPPFAAMPTRFYPVLDVNAAWGWPVYAQSKPQFWRGFNVFHRT